MFVLNCIKHAKTIVLHKKEVFKLSIIAGIPFQGLIHDLSKFSPSEFIESAKYFQGNRSPIMACKKTKDIPLLGNITKAEISIMQSGGLISYMREENL